MVFAKAPGSQYLFQVCCLVVLLSILLHGFSPTLVSRTKAKSKANALAHQTSLTTLEPEETAAQPPEIDTPRPNLPAANEARIIPAARPVEPVKAAPPEVNGELAEKPGAGNGLTEKQLLNFTSR